MKYIRAKKKTHRKKYDRPSPSLRIPIGAGIEKTATFEVGAKKGREPPRSRDVGKIRPTYTTHHHRNTHSKFNAHKQDSHSFHSNSTLRRLRNDDCRVVKYMMSF